MLTDISVIFPTVRHPEIPSGPLLEIIQVFASRLSVQVGSRQKMYLPMVFDKRHQGKTSAFFVINLNIAREGV